MSWSYSHIFLHVGLCLLILLILSLNLSFSKWIHRLQQLGCPIPRANQEIWFGQQLYMSERIAQTRQVQIGSKLTPIYHTRCNHHISPDSPPNKRLITCKPFNFSCEFWMNYFSRLTFLSHHDMVCNITSVRIKKIKGDVPRTTSRDN